MKKRVLKTIITLVMILSLCSCETTKDNKLSLYDLYIQQGFIGTVEECLNSMDDRMIPIVRTAYIDDVNEGYKGTLLEWATKRKNAFLNEEGEVVITLKSKAEVKIGKVAEFLSRTNNRKYDGIIKVAHTNARAGETGVEVEVNINKNPGILGMALTLSYDDKALKLVRVEEGNALSKALTFTQPKTLGSGSVFIWDGVYVEKGDIKNGSIMRLVFDVAGNAKSGNYCIALKPIDNSIIDNNLDPLDINIKDGIITIK